MWQNDGCSETAIKAFLYNFEKLTSGANLMIPESALSAVESLPSYDALTEEKPELLKDAVPHACMAAPPPHRPPAVARRTAARRPAAAPHRRLARSPPAAAPLTAHAAAGR